MPVRKIPRSHSRVTGRQAIGGGRSVGFESVLERDFIALMAFSPEVLAIEEQPIKVPVPGKPGRGSYYVPDFLVKRTDQPDLLVEVKPSEILALDGDKFAEKFRSAESLCLSRGWVFEIWTEKEIRIPRLKAAQFLLPYRFRKDIDHGLCARIVRALETSGPATINALLSLVEEADKPRCLTAIWYLVSSFRIKADLSAELSMASLVRCGTGGEP